MEIKFLSLDPRIGKEFPLPQYATSASAGVDLVACLNQEIVLEPCDKFLIPSGIAIALPSNDLVGLIFPRSGLGHKHGIILGNCVGVVDADYRGQIFISIWNSSDKTFYIKPGDRIAQLVIMPILKANFILSETLDETKRGSGGFGSTGL